MNDEEKKEVSAALVARVRGLGSDARDVRDAAHEATHALHARAVFWDRKSVDDAIRDLPWGVQVDGELLARAVEEVVCADLGVAYGSRMAWVNTSCLEASLRGAPFPTAVVALVRVALVHASGRARRGADAVLRLGRVARDGEVGDVLGEVLNAFEGIREP